MMLLTLIVIHGRGLLPMVHDAGWPGWLAVSLLLFGALACAVLGFFAVRGLHIPIARIRRWRFPSPEGGGTTTVIYPFTFQSASVDAPL